MNQILRWKREITAPFAGVSLTLAFAPYDFSYTALLALMFVYWCSAGQTMKQALLSGYLFGLGLFGSGIWWVYISIHDFGGADALGAGLLTVLLVMIWSIFPALSTALLAKIAGINGVLLRIASAALIWVAVEYLRGYWLLNGFPWLQIAYSQLHTPLAGFAPLAGVYGVGFLLAVSAFAGAEILRGKMTVRQGAIVLSLIWGGGWLLKGVQWTRPIGAPIRIALVQGNIDQAQKWQTDQRLSTLRLYRQLTEQHWGNADIVIWPETAIPAFLDEVKQSYLDPLAAVAREHGAELIISLPTGGDKNYYNSVMVLGESEALYHKNHLLPFGEYLPLQPLSGWVLDQLQIPLGNFSAGADKQPLLKAGGYPFITTICYEDAFGELVNRQIGDAAYLVNVTNDAWFGDSSQPYQHMQIAQMRALETGRYLVRATNTGLTGFVGPDGQLRKSAPLFSTTTITDTIVPMAGITPYAVLGDNGVFLLLALLLFVLYGWQCLIIKTGLRHTIGGTPQLTD